MMSAEEYEGLLDRLLKHRPFRPFTVVLLNGDRVEIDDPQYLCRSHEGAAGYIDANGSSHFLDLESVVEVIPPAEVEA
jgi:hypothetical protein